MRVLVLGVGNVLLQDEGVGVRIVEELQRRYELPPEVSVLDGGTAGMGLLDDLLDKDHLIIVDAVISDRPPGTLIRLTDDEVPAFFQTTLSPHQLGVAELLAALRLAGGGPRNVVLLGVVPDATELSLELSVSLCRQMVRFVQALAAELAALGLGLLPRRETAELGITWQAKV